MPRAYRLGKREAAVSETRDRILAATRSMLEEPGFSGLNLEELAERADVARKTIYYKFDSKVGLIEALVSGTEQQADLISRVQDAVSHPDVRQAMALYIGEACRFWAANFGMMRSLHGLAVLDPEIKKVLDEHDGTRRGRIGSLVDRLNQEKRLSAAYSRDQARDALWLLTSFSAFKVLHAGSRLSHLKVAAVLAQLADGIVAD